MRFTRLKMIIKFRSVRIGYFFKFLNLYQAVNTTTAGSYLSGTGGEGRGNDESSDGGRCRAMMAVVACYLRGAKNKRDERRGGNNRKLRASWQHQKFKFRAVAAAATRQAATSEQQQVAARLQLYL